MNHYFIIPGLGNSDSQHWQSFFERSGSNFKRINQFDWLTPTCDDWIKKIDDTISSYDLSSIVLIGHSLGCMAIVHWANRYRRRIKGALLVAPSDVEAPQYIFSTNGFNPIPLTEIAFTTTVVASSNDPWVSLERAEQFANAWGSKFINLGDAGHINVSSGHTNWEQGLEILKNMNSPIL